MKHFRDVCMGINAIIVIISGFVIVYAQNTNIKWSWLGITIINLLAVILNKE